jgi:hypothetical protein
MVERFLAERRPEGPVPGLLTIIASDCPRMQAPMMPDPCEGHLPRLNR